MKRSLLLGCGQNRNRQVCPPGSEEEGFGELITIDNNPAHNPDLVHDLSQYYEPPLKSFPIPLPDDYFDEIHAYEVLEHIGAQGDVFCFFAQFTDYWRLLVPGGYFCATCPKYDSMWAWGDPSHRRVITPGTLVFLCQPEYQKQVGVTSMSDFRHIYTADFDVVGTGDANQHCWGFILRAVKPSRHRDASEAISRHRGK